MVRTSHWQNEISSPGEFDGFRYYKKTQAFGTDQYQYSTTDSEHIHFGHGRYACPGRFVASTEMKIILSRIPLNYDMKFLRGQGRQGNMTVLELSFQDPAGRIMLKARGESCNETQADAYGCLNYFSWQRTKVEQRSYELSGHDSSTVP